MTETLKTQCWRCARWVDEAYWTSETTGDGVKQRPRILCDPCVDVVRDALPATSSLWVGEVPVENRGTARR